MIRSTNNSSVVLAFVVLFSPTVWAGEPNESVTPLRIEVSPSVIRFADARDALDGPQPPRTSFASWKPSYAIGIPLDGPTLFLPLFESGSHGFLAVVERSAKFSQRQKEFLEATRWVFNSHNPLTFHRPQDPNRPREFLLYAMTLEDAKELVPTYVDYAMRSFNGWIEALEGRLREAEGIADTTRSKMHELEAAIQVAQTSVAEIQKTVGYRTRQEAMEAIAELDRMRNAAQVDIAGIQAKIAAIQKWQTDLREAERSMAGRMKQMGEQQQTERPEMTKLKVMFMEEAIALEAAEARRKMATQLRGEANKFIDARQVLDNADIEKEKLTGEMATIQQNVVELREGLKGSRENQRPRLTDWTIRIYPAEWVVPNPDL